MSLRSQKGLSLMELTVAISLAAASSVMVGVAMKTVNRAGQLETKRSELDDSLAAMVLKIQSAGRAAQFCRKVNSTNNLGVECNVDLKVPPDPDRSLPTNVQFVWHASNQVLEWQTRDSGTAPWITRDKLANIEAVTVCSASDILADQCQLLPAKMNSTYRDHRQAVLAATGSDSVNDLFRMRIQAAAPKDAKGKSDFHLPTLQFSFYVRNPVPRVPGEAGYAFQFRSAR